MKQTAVYWTAGGQTYEANDDANDRGAGTLCVRWSIQNALVATVIYQLNAAVFRCEAFYPPPLPQWPIIESTSANWKSRGKVSGAKRLGVAVGRGRGTSDDRSSSVH